VPPLLAVVADAATVVAPVAKRPANPYGDFVFVGRASTSDVVLDDPSVSMSHAALRREAGDPPRWSLKDNRSHNGTHLDGERLDAGAWVPLRSGAQVTFGGVAAYFVDEEQLAVLARHEGG
jgi:pSer/pThr/pTyr-binding forkhead associated (FHA) protein